ncbi:MAG: four helix bundle protein [bacterium]
MYRKIIPKRAYYSHKQTRNKKPIRSFRDLEIYQKSQQAAVEITRIIQPFLAEKHYGYEKEFCELTLAIPVQIANAHTQRFEDPLIAMKILNEVIGSCNRMMIYLEQIREIYTERTNASEKNNAEVLQDHGADKDLSSSHQIFFVCEEMIKSYNTIRIKTLNLLKAWKKFYQVDEESR